MVINVGGLKIQFTPITFEYPRGNLFKLTQSSSVTSYLTEFEALANDFDGLLEAGLPTCLIYGLKTEEDKLQDISRSSQPRSPLKPNSETLLATKLSQGLLPGLCFRHLFRHELDERRENVDLETVAAELVDNVETLEDSATLAAYAYVILGAQWLKQLGLVLMNYNLLTITFFYNNTCVELHDDSLTPSVGLHQLQRLTRVYSEAQLLSLHIISPPEFITSSVHHPSFSLPDNLELVFSTLLTQYSHLFVEPTTVMPPCSTDHKIFVLPHALPVTVRPYHYPHSQKLEIESQALNAFTVSDRFPLPTIDELLDELGRVKFLFIDDLRNELSLNGHYQARCQQIVADPSITPEFSLSYVGTYELPASDDLLTSREVVFVLLKENFVKAQTKMKEIAEKKRREVQLEVDSLVYVKLQPYHQASLSGIKYKKLHIRYYGHFRVLSCIGPVAYKLELPSYSKINDVFHCSLLKAHAGPPPIQDDTLPPDSLGNHPLLFPLAIINSRTVIVARNFQKQVSVQ
ncbi:hypothetical protein KIW84_058268 [Lathyrus oleraceus]|uniref:Tf2-1-like SH3-like domain-containing protein n=1 Tax=Pisum sativum TaxID=3888 RepID=A0A9D4X5J0_PEA|nr:hypothetical protein KIW84_058268 [Pisum sativum]